MKESAPQFVTPISMPRPAVALRRQGDHQEAQGPQWRFARQDRHSLGQAAELVICQKTESISLNVLINAAEAGIFKFSAGQEIDDAHA